VYDAAGGSAAMQRIALALHRCCLADPLLHHPFSQPGQHPKHDERFAAYLGEVLGGPPAYTALGATQSSLMRMHLGEGGATEEYRAAFVACFDAAVDDAGVPHDAALRGTLHAYVTWAAEQIMPDHDDPAQVAVRVPMPGWTWEGPQRD